MAKLMVMVDVPNVSYETLLTALAFGNYSDWYDAKDPGMIVVDETYLKRANCDDSFYAFELVGVRP